MADRLDPLVLDGFEVHLYRCKESGLVTVAVWYDESLDSADMQEANPPWPRIADGAELGVGVARLMFPKLALVMGDSRKVMGPDGQFRHDPLGD